jgi:PKD repeat protein
MLVTFRQGIARHQTDLYGNPIFLQRNGAFVDLIVSPDPTILIFAHKQATYLVEELRTVQHAWGPFSGTTTQYLYWDVNLLTGELTRSYTSFPPIYTSDAPTSPSVDQHWFDTLQYVMRVWNGTKWLDKVRLFAGTYSSSAVLIPAPIGSQAGLNGSFDAGHIMLDSFGHPLRQSDGSFVTSTDWLNITNYGTATVRVESTVISGMANEYIPTFSIVQFHRGRRMVLGRSSDQSTRLAGIVVEDLYEGEVGIIISDGIVQNQAWTWTDDQIGRPVFCGPTGEVTTTAPSSGVIQQFGFIQDVDSIYVEIKQAIVIDEPGSTPAPPPSPPSGTPVADFSGDPVTGVAPLTVQFMDASTGAPDTIQWDFNNDGFIDTTVVNPVYVYSTPGTYTVREVASNTFGSSEKIRANYVTVLAPGSGAGNTNLGISFNAPFQATAGQAFTLQVNVSNDGLGDATNVARSVKLRSSDGSLVSVTNAPMGTIITDDGVYRTITLPAVTALASGGFTSSTFDLTVASTAVAVQLYGDVTSPEHDSTTDDNTLSLTIGVRP